MSEDEPSREELEERWRVLWARGEELTARHGRLLASLATVEDAIGRRALDQLHEEQENHKRDLADLRAAMERHGGFE
jgi:hypothetical protein